MRRLIAILAIILMIAVACGDDDDTGATGDDGSSSSDDGSSSSDDGSSSSDDGSSSSDDGSSSSDDGSSSSDDGSSSSDDGSSSSDDGSSSSDDGSSSSDDGDTPIGGEGLPQVTNVVEGGPVESSPALDNIQPNEEPGVTTGVTDDEIKLGTISDDGLPLPEIVTIPVVASVIAVFDAVNDQGGIHGRKVTVTNCDAAGEIPRFRACFRKLVDEDQVFAFITSITWGTGEVHNDLAAEEIPWFGSWGFFTSEWRDPWMFPTHMASIHEAHANSIWVRDVLQPETVGILFLNIPEDRAAVDAMHDIFDPAGIEVVEEIPVEITDPSLDAKVIAMQAADPDHIIHFAWSPPAVGWMLGAEAQGYWPPLGVSGNHFAAEALGEFIGDWPLRGMWTITTFAVWSDNAEYVSILEQYDPETVLKIHHITQSGYAGARIFVEAGKAIGPNLTRQAMIDAWEAGSWSAGPGLGVTFTWSNAQEARDNGTETADHDNQRCEYQFKYAQSEASDDLAVWEPAPEGYTVCDDFD